MATLQERLQQAQAALAATQSTISPEDQQEIDLRAQIAQAEQERVRLDKERRQLDLDRRLDSAQAQLPDVKFKQVMVSEFPDTFIVFYSGSAYGKYQEALTRAARQEAQNKSVDRPAISRKFAMNVVYDWNGEVFGVDATTVHPDVAAKLDRYFTQHPGLVTSVTNAAAELAGIYVEDRKS